MTTEPLTTEQMTTSQILSERTTRTAMLELKLNLLTDLACTETQALEWHDFDLEMDQLESADFFETLWRTRREISFSHRSRRTESVNFLCADEETAALEDWQLRHLAGLFAARHRLNVPGERWSVTAFGRSERDRSGRWLPDCIPDAIWTAEWGRISVEYDAGSHRLETVSEKALAYADGYDQQLWLCATAERRDHLRWRLEDGPLERSGWRVMRVDWR